MGQWTASVNHANILTLVHAGLSVHNVLLHVLSMGGEREMEPKDNLQEALMAISYSSAHFLSPPQCPPPHGEKGTGGARHGERDRGFHDRVHRNPQKYGGVRKLEIREHPALGVHG